MGIAESRHRPSKLQREAEQAARDGDNESSDHIDWVKWVTEWRRNALTVVCGFCGLLNTEQHCYRKLPREQVAASLQRHLSDEHITVPLCDRCHADMQKGEAISRDELWPGDRCPQLSALSRYERRLVALAEANVFLVHLPRGQTVAQRGGAYVAPLPAPRACDVLEGTHCEGNVLYHRPPGFTENFAVPVRAPELLEALRS